MLGFYFLSGYQYVLLYIMGLQHLTCVVIKIIFVEGKFILVIIIGLIRVRIKMIRNLRNG